MTDIETPTPGPWSTDPEYKHEMVLGSDRIIVSDCSILHKQRSIETNRANARLIAASPDLLELVWQYRNDLERPVTDSGSLERRLDAIDRVLKRVGGDT